jgi:hypothetical protein
VVFLNPGFNRRFSRVHDKNHVVGQRVPQQIQQMAEDGFTGYVPQRPWPFPDSRVRGETLIGEQNDGFQWIYSYEG